MTGPRPKHWLHSQFTVRSDDGLHARPAIQFARLARQFESTTQVRLAGDDLWVDAKSVSKVIGLRAQGGKVIDVRACGDDAPAVMARLGRFFEGDVTEQNEDAE